MRRSVVPVADGLFGGFVRGNCFELRERDCHLPSLPADLEEHVVFAGILVGHAQDIDGFVLAEG